MAAALRSATTGDRETRVESWRARDLAESWIACSLVLNLTMEQEEPAP